VCGQQNKKFPGMIISANVLIFARDARKIIYDTQKLVFLRITVQQKWQKFENLKSELIFLFEKNR
jgi:hypothetical protein